MLRTLCNLFVLALLIAAILGFIVAPILVFAALESDLPAKVTKLVPVVGCALAVIAFLLCMPRVRSPIRHDAKNANTGITNTEQAREAAIRGLKNRANIIETALGGLPEPAQKPDKWMQLEQARDHIDRQEFGTALYLLHLLENWIAYVTEPAKE